MVTVENIKLEKNVLSGMSCIAVPVEVFLPCNGEPTIVTYSICLDKANEWESIFGNNILSEDSIKWAEKEFKSFVENLGYVRAYNENEHMLEYVLSSDKQMTKSSCFVKVHKISSNAVLGELCKNSGCDIEIADDGEDIIVAVVEDGVILAYAGINDVIYSDGSVEISVETAPDFRRMGYGEACVRALTKHLSQKGTAVRYKCAKSNIPSLALCEKIGFELEGERFSLVYEKM